jgi:hypothetical protein
MEWITRNYFENLYSNIGNLEEMDKFLDTNDQPKLNQGNINHLNRYVTSNEPEAAVETTHTHSHTKDLMDSLLNCTKSLKNY